MYEWLSGNAFRMQITAARSTLTLNQAAVSKFRDCLYVRVGLDGPNLKLALQPVETVAVKNGDVDLASLHKLSHGKGYARISNRRVLEAIERYTGRPCQNDKYAGVWNEAEQILEVDLSSREV